MSENHLDQFQSIVTSPSVLASLEGKLIVSCQADPGDPMDHVETVARIAASVLRGGAGGLRAEGADCVKAFRAITALPIVGMIKAKDSRGQVYITPTFVSAQLVADAGADIIAVDCTHRRLVEQEPWPEIVRSIHARLGKLVLADVANLEDAIAAQEAGADAVATTLYGDRKSVV